MAGGGEAAFKMLLSEFKSPVADEQGQPSAGGGHSCQLAWNPTLDELEVLPSEEVGSRSNLWEDLMRQPTPFQERSLALPWTKPSNSLCKAKSSWAIEDVNNALEDVPPSDSQAVWNEWQDETIPHQEMFGEGLPNPELEGVPNPESEVEAEKRWDDQLPEELENGIGQQLPTDKEVSDDNLQKDISSKLGAEDISDEKLLDDKVKMQVKLETANMPVEKLPHDEELPDEKLVAEDVAKLQSETGLKRTAEEIAREEEPEEKPVTVKEEVKEEPKEAEPEAPKPEEPQSTDENPSEKPAKRQKKLTFANRHCPKTEPSAWMWQASRAAFEEFIQPQLMHPAKEEPTFYVYCQHGFSSPEHMTKEDFHVEANRLAEDWLESNPDVKRKDV